MGIKMPKTSVALGMFDGVHLGHLKVINAALSKKNLMSAAFTFKSLRNIENITPHQAKFELLKKTGIEIVYSSDFDGIKDLSADEFVVDVLVNQLNCAHVSCGKNFRFSQNAAANARDLQQLCRPFNIEVTIVGTAEMGDERISSTRIRKEIKVGNVHSVSKMLGRELSYSLEVVEGAKLGRVIDFPTINQVIPSSCVLPKFGVYKSRTIVGNVSYPSLTNIGIKPTVVALIETPQIIMETHILDFTLDLYGQSIEVALLDFIREEQKFDSLDALKEQIQNDVRKI
ncbi:MAG: riboflavin biosynthesis protein RibF [Oscillospiraceae bacterium]|nr:riboflavin biosynthesis protein RibF [Oscillospiraceae bacterium]